jgi:hypothetical protein
VLIDHDANGDRSKIDPATFNALRTVDHALRRVHHWRARASMTW